MKHGPDIMLRGDKWPVKHRGRNGRSWNVWRATWTCQTCGATRTALLNPMTGRRYVCDGEHQRVTKNGPPW